jgi:hypothetical protein
MHKRTSLRWWQRMNERHPNREPASDVALNNAIPNVATAAHRCTFEWGRELVEFKLISMDLAKRRRMVFGRRFGVEST